MIIDSHVHIWPADHAGADPGASLPDLDASPRRLIALMDRHDVARAIVVQHSAFTHDDSYLARAGAAFPDRLTMTASLPVSPTQGDVDRVVGGLRSGAFAGARIVLLRPEAMELLARGALDALLGRAAKLGRPISVLVRSPQAIAAIGQIASGHPALNLVVDHMANVAVQEDSLQHGQEALLALADHPRVHVKVSLHHRLSAEAYPWADLIPVQQRLLDAFGARRLLWGSNFPMFMDTPTYAERLSVLARHFPFPNAETRALILGGVADRLWPPGAAATGPMVTT